MLIFHRLNGTGARRFVQDIANLRLKVFYEFPYLYEGSLSYEEKYLETYFRAKHSFIYLIEDNGKMVGATTSIWASEEEESFKKPFADYGINPEAIFYFGESVLLPAYRGRGLGKEFFLERENYAKSLPFIEYLAFCAVVRPTDHPERPAGYGPLDSFWQQMGFYKEDKLVTSYTWKDRGEDKETSKKMQFWLKKIR